MGCTESLNTAVSNGLYSIKDDIFIHITMQNRYVEQLAFFANVSLLVRDIYSSYDLYSVQYRSNKIWVSSISDVTWEKNLRAECNSAGPL